MGGTHDNPGESGEETLPSIIARLEADPAARDEHDFHRPFSQFGQTLQKRGEPIPPELISEELAFLFHAHDHQNPSAWGLYFGPMFSGATRLGDPWDSPSLADVTEDVMVYWSRRAGESAHPIMRARYADLLWELPKEIPTAKPSAAMARIAIDAYLDAIEGRRYEHSAAAVGKGKRALEIALSLRDNLRVSRAKEVLLGLEQRVADDDSPGLWGFCFDRFVDPPNKHVALSDEERDKLVVDMEARLARFAGREPDEYHPSPAETATSRLAHYYRRLGRREDVSRVLRTYGEIVRRMHGKAAPLVVSHSLEQLYDLFKAFELHADADALNELLRVTGEETLGEMQEFSVKVEIPHEESEKYFAAMTAGSSQEFLMRVAVHFVPKRQEVERQLRELAQRAPISFLMTHTIKDEEGRTIARVGPLDSDLEGNVLRYLTQNLELAIPWLRESMARALDKKLISADILLSFLMESPLFQEKRRVILEAGLAAYIRRDAMQALHLLVPQVEQALRQLAILIKAPTYTQKRGGGLHARTLDDLLRDDAIGQVFGQDIITYLRALFTDDRGWNVRNTICHGLAPIGMLTMPVADRVVHALLVMALVRQDQHPLEQPTD